MKKKVFPFVVILIVAALLCLWLVSDLSDGEVSYQSFASLCEDGKVSSVTIAKDSISFVSNGERLKTSNPSSPTLKEELLLKGIEVDDKSAEDAAFWLDIAFDVVFFGAIAFGVIKLASWYSKTFRLVRKTGVTFDDIAGMHDLKEEMRRIADLLKKPQVGIRQTRGIILEGAPGNGKTMFAKALAQECKVNFMATRGADFQGSLMGMGAFKVRMLFARARRNAPCMVFIDEFDSIGERRNYAGSGIDKENNRIITTLLNEMDGFKSGKGVLVVAATNSFQSLDPALVRPGRFDIKYTVSNPDAATRAELVAIYTKGRKLDNLAPEALVSAFDGLSCSAIETILNEAYSIAVRSNNGAIDAKCLRKASSNTGLRIRLKGDV